MEDKQLNKKIEIVTGDGSDLEISPVEEHFNIAKPKPREHKDKIVIPEEIKKENSNKEDE